MLKFFCFFINFFLKNKNLIILISKILINFTFIILYCLAVDLIHKYFSNTKKNIKKNFYNKKLTKNMLNFIIFEIFSLTFFTNFTFFILSYFPFSIFKFFLFLFYFILSFYLIKFFEEFINNILDFFFKFFNFIFILILFYFIFKIIFYNV